MMMNTPQWRRAMLSTLVAASLAGCSANQAPWQSPTLIDSQALLDKGQTRAALDLLRPALQKTPNDTALKVSYQGALSQYKAAELGAAQDAMSRNALNEAKTHLDNIMQFDRHDMRTRQLLDDLLVVQRLNGVMKQAVALQTRDPQAALAKVNDILTERPGFPGAEALRRQLQQATSQVNALDPVLSPGLKKTISLRFRDQRIMDIFETMSRISGINFVFDHDMPSSLTASLYANNTSVLDAINLLLSTNGLGKKVLNQNTFLIYPRLPNKIADYQDMLVKTFYLSNADPKQVFNALRQTLDSRNLYIDERLNAIVMRGAPGEIQVASRLINSLDLQQSEVTLDVTVLEVDKTGSEQLGLMWPGALGFSPGDTSTAGNTSAVTTNTGTTVTSNNTGFGNSFNRAKWGTIGFDGKSLLTLNALQTSGHVRVLSNPKVRVRNREKATIKVGGKVPIPSSTTTAVGTTSSINYQDTGLTLIVQPNIGLNNELSVNVDLTIDNAQQGDKDAQGNPTYNFTTRVAKTIMTVKDNQTQVLGGLISYTNNLGNRGLPGLRSIMGLGKLFGADSNTDDEKQVVMLITPHIDRSINLPAAATSTFISGTATQVNSSSPLVLRDGATLEMPPGGGANPASSMPQTNQGQPGSVPQQQAPSLAPGVPPAAPPPPTGQGS